MFPSDYSNFQANACHCERQNGASQSHNLYNINEITTSNASHSPRNDIEDSCKTQVVNGTATFPRNDIESSCNTQYGGWSGTLPCNDRTSSYKIQVAGAVATLPHRGEGISNYNQIIYNNQPSTQPSPTGEEVSNYKMLKQVQHDTNSSKRTYSPIHLFSYSPCKRCAFTLAEVLITLGIIGVVAAMTMPSLIANHREKQTVAQLKKAYSTIQQAYLMAINKYGDAESWSLSNTHIGDDDEGNAITDYTSAYTVFNYLAENMKSVDGGKANQYITHEYDSYSLDGTFRNTISTNRDIPNIVLADGTVISSGWIENGNMDIYVSLNKCMNKGKCTLGKDTFYFQMYFSEAKIVPEGSPTYSTTYFKNLCNKGITDKNNGRGCTAWVLQNENMDYMHCDDLDWNTKIRCK